MTEPSGPVFVTGLTDAQMLKMEQLAEDYVIEVLTQVIDAYADRVLLAGGGTPDSDSLTAAAGPDDLDGAAQAINAGIARTVSPLVAEVYYSSAGKVRADLARRVNSPIPSVRSLDALDRIHGIWSESMYENIGQNAWSAMSQEMATGFDEGESIEQIAARIRGVAGTQTPSATLVARTAIIGASNGGSLDMARASGLDMLKEWLATPDARTRATHRAADGQRVPIDGTFTVGGWAADHPGDPSLPPEEQYNCRCTLGYITDPEPQQRRGPTSGSPLSAPTPAELAPPTSSVAQEMSDADRARWGTKEDPASRMTVSDLRQIAKDDGAGSLYSGYRKADLIRALRDRESVYRRQLLPPLPRIDPMSFVRASTTRPGTAIDDVSWLNPDRGVVLGRGGASRLPLGDTGPGGVRISDWVADSGYVVRHGRAWRIDGINYIVETPAFDPPIPAQIAAVRRVKEMHDMHHSVPGASKYNHTYQFFTGRNPADAMWEVKYNRPGMRSAATAGRGRVTFWDGTTPSERWIFTHETGHNADSEYAHQRGYGSDGQLWRDAGAADRAYNDSGAGVQDFHRSPGGGHPIELTAQHGRPYPFGISGYGQSDAVEDWAESYLRYLQGPVGDGYVPGMPDGIRAQVFFRDLFPARARMFDDLFPDFAKVQLADIAAQRGAIPSLARQQAASKNKALRDAARARQKVIDKADSTNIALADIDETIATGSDPGVLALQLSNAVTMKALTKAEAAAIERAVATGDPVKVRAALARVAKKYGVSYTNAAGDLGVYDPLTMRSIGPMIPEGAQVRIVRRASNITVDGQTVILEKAQVRALSAEDLAAIESAEVQRVSDTANLVATLRAEMKATGAVTPERVGQIADRYNVAPAARRALVSAAKDPDALARALAGQLRAGKVKAQGVVGRGAAFDAKTMDAAGQRIEPGTKVKIIAPGYVAQVNGRSVLVRRALVEPVAPAAPKISIPKAEVAARQRQGVIDSVRPISELLAEAAELVGTGASREVTKFRLRARAKRQGIPDSMIAPLLAKVDGSEAELFEHLALVAKREGLTPIGAVDEVVAYDRKLQRLAGGSGLPAGVEQVVVVRPGYSFTYRGEKILIQHALVEPVEPVRP